MTPDPRHRSNALDQLRDHLLPEDPPAEPEGAAFWIWLALAAALSLGLVWLLIRRRVRSPTRSVFADQTALRGLDQLEACGLPSPAEVDTFHVRLAEILRVYLESSFGLPATRQTTSEFLEDCQDRLPLAAADRSRLAEVLHRCDLAKFARAQSTPEVCLGTLRQVRHFIESTRRRRATAD